MMSLTSTQSEMQDEQTVTQNQRGGAGSECQRWTVYRWVEEENLSAMKIGKQNLRVIGNSVNKLIAENRTDH